MSTATASRTYTSGHCDVAAHDRCWGTYAGVNCSCACHTTPTVIAVSCFFGCSHVVRDEDPHAAHDAMEDHYRAQHWQQIRAIVGWIAS